jgi:hypothetical protein
MFLVVASKVIAVVFVIASETREKLRNEVKQF